MKLFGLDLRKKLGVYNLERKLRASGVSDLIAAQAREEVKKHLAGLDLSPEALRVVGDLAREVADVKEGKA